MTEHWHDNLRVHYDRGDASVPDITPTPERSHWQKRRDDDLAQIEEGLRSARDLIADALEGLSNYVTPQHRNLDTLIGQTIEQVIEFKRVKQ
jgi:hypothetical protein